MNIDKEEPQFGPNLGGHQARSFPWFATGWHRRGCRPAAGLVQALDDPARTTELVKSSKRILLAREDGKVVDMFNAVARATVDGGTAKH